MSVTLIDRTRPAPLDPAKFVDPDRTAKGEARASIGLERLDTLWFNTGTLCNIECVNCYIESSPMNDRLSYISAAEVEDFLAEIASLGLATGEIGFTGGEPFMNPEIIAMLDAALARDFEVLVLTNAMQPMQRRAIGQGLLQLKARFANALTLRVSLDHYGPALHETERGAGSYAATLAGLDWLTGNGFRVSLAGRTCWGEDQAVARAGYARLCGERGYRIDTDDPTALVLFPEMDECVDVPEITTACFGILGVDPRAIMCAQSRMVVKRTGAETPVVLPCTLLPYDRQFEMGPTLKASLGADGGAFDHGRVKLNHPHCAKFCVLGGGSCSAGH